MSPDGGERVPGGGGRKGGTPVVRVRKHGLQRAAARHPWIYRSDVVDAGGAAAGDLVEVHGPRGHLVGRGLYSASSEIALRLLVFGDVAVGDGFLKRRLDEALAYREVVAPGVDALRLVNAEGDGLPGLVVDRYGDVLAVQALNAGVDRRLDWWCDLLAARLAPRSIVERDDVPARTLEGLERRERVLRGEDPGEVEIHQGPAVLAVEPLGGQKTGAFLDQRENREAAARWARGEVLDAFCNEGGYAVRLALVDAVEGVEAVDSSAAALERLRANAARNGVEGRVEAVEANAFDHLRRLDRDERRFDTVILDPPAFARNRASVRSAERGYKEINLRAMKILRPGGVLVTSSCSYHMSERHFLETLSAAASDVGLDVSVLERRGQSLDHRIRLTVPETAYLKCVVLRVEGRS